MASAKDAHSLTSHYEKGFKAKYGTKSSANGVTARWNFDTLLRQMSIQEVKDLIDYYFTTPPTNMHSLDWFFYNYDKLVQAKAKAVEDAAHRRKLMEESKQRAEAWRQSGKQGIAND
jgi:hypothetical protein